MEKFSFEHWRARELAKVNRDPAVKKMLEDMKPPAKLQIILDAIKKLRNYE